MPDNRSYLARSPARTSPASPDRELASTLSNTRDPARRAQPLGIHDGCRARARYPMRPYTGSGTFWQRPAGRSHTTAAIVWYVLSYTFTIS